MKDILEEMYPLMMRADGPCPAAREMLAQHEEYIRKTTKEACIELFRSDEGMDDEIRKEIVRRIEENV